MAQRWPRARASRSARAMSMADHSARCSGVTSRCRESCSSHATPAGRVAGVRRVPWRAGWAGPRSTSSGAVGHEEARPAEVAVEPAARLQEGCEKLQGRAPERSP